MRTNFSRITKFVVTVLISVGQIAIGSNAHAANDLCTAQGYSVGFFNGVWNTPDQAAEGLAALRVLNGATLNGEPIQYEVFYNQTGSTAGATGMQDIAEVFIQRAAEIDSTGELGKRWEYFWESFTGERTLTDKIAALFPNSTSLLSQLYSDITTKVMAGWSYLLSNPPTASTYAGHNARLDTLSLQRQKLMLVAHSQGNLFMNHAYDYISPKSGTGSVKAVHIASASPTLRGDYLLANIDLVINGLRVQGLTTVPAINLTIPTALSDASGHTLVGTYLDGSRGGRSRVGSMMTTAMQNLTTPATTGSAGSFTVTLNWDGTGDVDLHTFEPSGSHVYYQSKSGVVGYLDVDNTVASGPEHYFASCDPSILQAGTYRVGINNYSRATGRTATIQVATSKGGTILTKTMGVGAELGSAGNSSPISAVSVVVTKNATTGAFTFTAN